MPALRHTCWNACFLPGGVCTALAQLSVRRREPERVGPYSGKRDGVLEHKARGGDGSEVELRYCCRQAHALSIFGDRAEAGGLQFVVRPTFRGRFETVEFEVVAPDRVAILRCRRPLGLDILSVHPFQLPGGPAVRAQPRALRERVADRDVALTVLVATSML